MTHRRSFAAPLALAFAVTVPAAITAQQPSAPITVLVDGSTVAFDQPPVAVAGRIFVPLRGVFERLGASVVYANGQINATSGRHTIGLHVGEQTATVDGATQTLESPPMLVGGRVLVPLRFVATALGANVAFDDATQTAAITRNVPAETVTALPASSADAAPTAVPRPPNSVVIRLIREEPASGSVAARLRPEISASFAEPIDPNSVRVQLDGRDVSTDTYVSARAFSYDPTFDLPAGPHTISVVGRSAAREPFDDRWDFTTGAPAARNYLAGVEPPDGTVVRSPLVISGITRPSARVRIVGTSSETIAHFSELAAGSAATAVTANARGFFTARLELVETGAGVLDVRIESTTTDGGVAIKTLRLRL